MAKPMAIQTRTNRLVRQRDELDNGFDPLVDSGRSILSPHSIRKRTDWPQRTQVSRWKNLIPGFRTPIQPNDEAILGAREALPKPQV